MFFSVRTACAWAAVAISERDRAEGGKQFFMVFSWESNGSINRGRTLENWRRLAHSYGYARSLRRTTEWGRIYWRRVVRRPVPHSCGSAAPATRPRSLANRLARWVSTVRGDRSSARPISLLVSPPRSGPAPRARARTAGRSVHAPAGRPGGARATSHAGARRSAALRAGLVVDRLFQKLGRARLEGAPAHLHRAVAGQHDHRLVHALRHQLSSTVRPLMPGMRTSSTMAPMPWRSNPSMKASGSAQVCTRRPTVPISSARLDAHRRVVVDQMNQMVTAGRCRPGWAQAGFMASAADMAASA
jgi:hypothetical protein